MPDPFNPDNYNFKDPFSPSVRGMVHAVVAAMADETANADDDSPYAAIYALYPTFNRELGRLLYPYTNPADAEDQSIGEIGDRLMGLRLDDLYGTPVGKVYLRNIAQALQVRNDDDDAYANFAALAGTFNARLTALVDLLLGGAALLKYDGGLKFRNAGDSAYVNLEALAGTFNARLTAISDVLVGNKVLLKPYATGNLLLLRNPDDTANADLYGNAAYFADRVKADVIEPNTGSVITLGGAGHRVKLPNVTDETGTTDRDTYRFESGSRREFRMATTVGAAVVPKTLNMTTLLASYEGTSDTYRNVKSIGVVGEAAVGQTFKPAYASEIGAIVLTMRVYGAPADSCRVGIWNVDGDGKPTGSALAVSQAVEGAELSTTAGRVAFRFSSPVSRTAGQATAFALIRIAADLLKYYQVAVDNTSPAYADGQVAVLDGNVWTLYAEDASFFEVWSPTTGGASGGGGGAPTDEYVKVSENDTTTGYLGSKLAAGTGITITEVNDAGDEDAQIAHAQVATGDLHTEYQKESEKDAASGYAALDANSLVIKKPADCSYTAGAAKIPLGNAVTGKLNAGWIQEVLAYADLTDDPYADHNARHEPGGGDPMAVDAAAATGSLRTIGTGALTACAGNDARLSNKAAVYLSFGIEPITGASFTP